MAFNLMLLFCVVAVINNVVVPSSARQLLMTTATTSPNEKEVMIGTENHRAQVVHDPMMNMNYNVENKEERFDKNQLFPPFFPYPYTFPFPRAAFPFPRAAFPFPRFPLPTPYIPGLPWPITPGAGVSSLPYPTMDNPTFSPYRSAPSPPN